MNEQQEFGKWVTLIAPDKPVVERVAQAVSRWFDDDDDGSSVLVEVNHLDARDLAAEMYRRGSRKDKSASTVVMLERVAAVQVNDRLKSGEVIVRADEKSVKSKESE